MAPPTMLMAGDPDELVGQIEEHPVGLPTRWEPGGASRDLGRGLRYEGLKHKPSAPFAPSWTWKRGCARAALYPSRATLGAEIVEPPVSAKIPWHVLHAGGHRARCVGLLETNCLAGLRGFELANPSASYLIGILRQLRPT
jgi:hypothetical protein